MVNILTIIIKFYIYVAEKVYHLRHSILIFDKSKPNKLKGTKLLTRMGYFNITILE